MTRSTRTRPHYRVTFVALLLGVTAYALLQSMVVPVLATFQKDFHTSVGTATWVLTAYLVSASIFTPILGRLGDMWGKERFLLVTLVALGVGSLMAALAHTITLLIVARVIQGIGGGVLPLAFGIIRDEFPPERVSGGVGIAAALVAVGAGAGIVLAGPVVSALDVHWLFWIPAMLIAVTLVVTYLFVPESPTRIEGGVSWLAAVLLSGWLVALLVAVSEGPTWGWASAKVLGLLALTVVLGVLWVVVELRAKSPLVDMRMMRAQAVWTNNLVAFLFGVGMYSVMAFLPEFLQTPKATGYGFGATATQSGLYLAPLTATMFVFGMFSGKIDQRIGSKAAVILGSIASGASYLILAVAHAQSWEIYLASALLGVGLGLGFSAMSALIVQAVPAHQTGIASGMNANIRTIGGSIGAGITASIVTSRMVDGLPAGAGYTWGFAFLAIVTGVAIVASFLIPSRPDALAQVTHDPHLDHAELAVVPGATITDA